MRRSALVGQGQRARIQARCLSPHLSSTLSLLCVVGSVSASRAPGSLERVALSSRAMVVLLLDRVPVLNSGSMARPWKPDT